MSHQTGIKCGNDLKNVFSECTNNGDIRCVQVAITNETLTCATTVKKTSESWENEYDEVVLSLLKDKQPSYLIYQMNSKNEWLLITFSPDDSPLSCFGYCWRGFHPLNTTKHAHQRLIRAWMFGRDTFYEMCEIYVREKMLYAATRATLKSEFGGGFIVDEIFGNSKKEVTYEGYQQYQAHKDAPPPLTNAEEEMKLMDETESKASHGTTTRHQTVQGIAFPIREDAQDAIKDFKNGIVNHIELNVDTEKEEIFKVSSQTVGASDLESLISKHRAGYHIFHYAHRHNGEDVDSTVFIYSMPGYSIPIKARMLYSSCKAPLLDTLETHFEIKLDKKLECGSDEVISEGFLRDEIHPPEVDKKQAFGKPKAPGRRAPTRRPR